MLPHPTHEREGGHPVQMSTRMQAPADTDACLKTRTTLYRAHGCDSYPLGGVIQHLLPGGVELSLVILQQPLLSQGDGFLGGTEHLCGPLEVLCGFLSFQLSLCKKEAS